MRFACPHCGKDYELPVGKLAELAGKRTRCTACQKAVTMPAAPLIAQSEPGLPPVPAKSPESTNGPATAEPAVSIRAASPKLLQRQRFRRRSQKGPWLFAAALAAVCLAGVIWLINGTGERPGSVEIVADEGTLRELSVQVAGQSIDLPAGGDWLELPPGNHWLTIERPGFRRFERAVRVASGQPTRIQPTWIAEARQATLVVEWPVEERFGARLFIDRQLQRVGIADPLRIELEPGKHRVEVHRNRQVASGEDFDLEAEGLFVFRPVRHEMPSRPQPGEALAAAGAPPDAGAVAPEALAVQPFDGWLQSLEAAKAIAARDNKHLLILFDGSDWCGWSKAMFREVVGQPGFLPLVREDYVTVHVDFPRHELARGLVEDAQRNDGLARYYAVDGFPTVVLADAMGQPYETLGFEEGAGLDGFFRQTAAARDLYGSLRERHANLEQAIREGLSDARGLLRVALPEELVGYYLATVDGWYDVARKSDPKNENGIREAVYMVRREALLRHRGKQLSERLDLVKEMLDEFVREARFMSSIETAQQYAWLHDLWQVTDAQKATTAAREALEALPAEADDVARRKLQDCAEGVLSTGSGFVVSDGGLIVTNAHVVGFSRAVWVTFGDNIGEQHEADVIACDASLDLAILQLRTKDKLRLKPLSIQSTSVERAEETALLGYPLGTDGVTYNTARISELPETRPDQRLIFDATVNPGNSGGPLVSRSGHVVGVVFAKTSNTELVDSVGLAVPADKLLEFMEQQLDADAWRAIRKKPARRPAEWQVIVRNTVPSIVRIVNRRLLLSAEEVQARNGRAWEVVVQPGQTREQYNAALQDAMEACQAIPSADHLNTLGTALYRCEQYAEALQQLATAAAMNEETLGTALPSDAALIALVQLKLGNRAQAEEARQALEVLMALPTFADNAANQQLAEEVSAVFGPEPD